jgi:hypothetical protein
VLSIEQRQQPGQQIGRCLAGKPVASWRTLDDERRAIVDDG